MKRLLAWPLLTGLAWAAESGADSAEALPQKVEAVSQSAVQSAFQILRSEYIRGNELTFDELNRAAFQGLLERLDQGAELIRKVDAERPVTRRGILSEKLSPEVTYLRPLSFVEEEIPQLEAALKKHVEEKLPYLILDLRSVAPAGDFSIASAMLQFFVPRGELLFKLKQVGREDAQLFIANADPLWNKPVIVLVDGETCNLGETMAAVLHDRKQALLIGSKTKGGTVRYETLPLDNEWLLRFARAEMLLPDDRSLFRVGLTPDFPLDLPVATKRQIFDAAGPVKDSLFDRSRPRYNEAALIARKNPELDSYIRRSAGESLTDDRPEQRDTVLQRAVDMLNTRTHLQGYSLKWPTSPKRPPATPAPTVKKAEPPPKP